MRRLPAKLYQASERDIENTCTGFLELDGWRTITTDPPRLRGLGVTEKGMADKLYIRYLAGACIEIPAAVRSGYLAAVLKAPAAEVLWVEWKKPSGVVSVHQRNWHADERRRGALTWIAGEDFPASIDGFLAFYRASSLNRGPI